MALTADSSGVCLLLSLSIQVASQDTFSVTLGITSSSFSSLDHHGNPMMVKLVYFSLISGNSTLKSGKITRLIRP